ALPGEAALELPGATEHRGYPLAVAVSAVFASIRADVTGAEELCRRAADASARQDPPDWRGAGGPRRPPPPPPRHRAPPRPPPPWPTDPPVSRPDGDRADASLELPLAVAGHLLIGDAPAAVPLANEAIALARQAGAPALVATGLLAAGAAVADTPRT